MVIAHKNRWVSQIKIPITKKIKGTPIYNNNAKTKISIWHRNSMGKVLLAIFFK